MTPGYREHIVNPTEQDQGFLECHKLRVPVGCIHLSRCDPSSDDAMSSEPARLASAITTRMLQKPMNGHVAESTHALSPLSKHLDQSSPDPTGATCKHSAPLMPVSAGPTLTYSVFVDIVNRLKEDGCRSAVNDDPAEVVTRRG
jgi:hypothetical protein